MSKIFNQKILSERLREQRLEKKLSVEKLAKEIDSTGASISEWENGRGMIVENLFKLAVFYDVSLDYLVGLID